MTPDQLKLHSFVFVSHPKRLYSRKLLYFNLNFSHTHRHTYGVCSMLYMHVFRINVMKLMHLGSFFYLLLLLLRHPAFNISVKLYKAIFFFFFFAVIWKIKEEKKNNGKLHKNATHMYEKWT